MRSDSGINCAHSLRTFRCRLILAVDAFSQQKKAWRPWQCCVEEHYLYIVCVQLFICRRLPVTDINYMYIHRIASTEDKAVEEATWYYEYAIAVQREMSYLFLLYNRQICQN